MNKVFALWELGPNTEEICEAYIFHVRSAGSLLSEVIGQLDDSSSQSQAVLAMANFTKYVVSHEETVMVSIKVFLLTVKKEYSDC